MVATARQPNRLDDLAQQHPKDRLLVLPLDVTQPEQVAAAFAEAKRAFGRIDIVFNNAGFGHMGELEATEEATARALFETNFWGAISVTREAVKCFRETNPPGEGGRLLQMSSYGGLVGIPGASFYGASKFGMSSFLHRTVVRFFASDAILASFPLFRQRWRERPSRSQRSSTLRGISRSDSSYL